MKKFGLLVISIVGLSSTFYAQQHWCGTDAQLQKTLEKNPELVQPFIEHNIRISSGQIVSQDRTDPIIIPVVVHVVHDGGTSNTSYAQIQSGIDQLNIDYNRQNADTIDTRDNPNAPFWPISANVDIQFALAKIDPNGDCTNGVERRYSPEASYDATDNTKHYSSGGLDAWDRSKYMNIWIVNSIASDGSPGTILGIAAFPQFADDNYGLMIRHDSYGTIGTASGDRTLTHEIGHCLGLFHTFQGPIFGAGTGCHSTACGSAGDFVCDTPPATASHWDCPPTYNSCTSIPTNDFYGIDVYDQWENYMSYAPCQNMFSVGQKTMIDGNLAGISFLANLVSLSNQAATGVGLPDVLCQATFYGDMQTICAGNSVNFFDESYSNVTGWSWTFAGGTPATSTTQNPTVTYANAGTYSVTLEATDGVTNVTKTFTNYILVLSDPGDIIPYKESFENLVAVPDNDRFLVENINGESTWDLNNSVSYWGNDCIYLDNFGINDGTTDNLISGTIDLSGVSASDEMNFYFYFAYRRKASTNDEKLRFYVSKDCGETWALRKNLQNTGLGTTVSATEYIPASAEEWTLVNVTNITSDYFVSDFRYRFEFINDGGNNIYIDHINMYPESMVGLMSIENSTALTVYPNPGTDNITISFFTGASTHYNVCIFDALGNEIAIVYSGSLSTGLNTLSYNMANLSAGVYVIRVASEDTTETIKLIKE